MKAPAQTTRASNPCAQAVPRRLARALREVHEQAPQSHADYPQRCEVIPSQTIYLGTHDD
jgi:hypothetical protein